MKIKTPPSPTGRAHRFRDVLIQSENRYAKIRHVLLEGRTVNHEHDMYMNLVVQGEVHANRSKERGATMNRFCCIRRPHPSGIFHDALRIINCADTKHTPCD